MYIVHAVYEHDEQLLSNCYLAILCHKHHKVFGNDMKYLWQEYLVQYQCVRFPELILFVFCRSNLDPEGTADDSLLWKVLETVGMKATIQALSGELGQLPFALASALGFS